MIAHSIKFNVKGTTFKNEDNIDIQKEIKKITKEYRNNNYFSKEDLYGGYTNKDIKEMYMNVSEYEGITFGGKIELSSYKDEPCFKVYISTYEGVEMYHYHKKEKETNEKYFHIGYIPKELVDEVLQYWNDEEITKYIISISITGGKYKHSEMDEEDYEKEKIVIEELTYGFVVDLAFHNEKVIKKTEKIEKTEDYIQTEDEKRKEQKASAKIGLIAYPLIFIGSLYMMPFGIIFTLISVIGFIVCLALAF